MTEVQAKKIRQLADRKGIEPEYQDVRGVSRPVSLETLIEVLKSLGLDVETEEGLDREIRQEMDREWEMLSPSPLVLSQDRLPEEILIRLPWDGVEPPANGLPEDLRVRLTVEEESGEQVLHVLPFEDLRFKELQERHGRRRLSLGAPFPQGLPLGYHRLHLFVSQGGRRYAQKTEVIIGPGKAFLPSCLEGTGKKAGLMVSLAGLRSRTNWGIGDFHDLKGLITWAVDRLGVSLIGLLPLHALSNREPYNISPYYPSSRLYRNPIYLSVPWMEDFQHCPSAQALVSKEETQKRIEELRRSEKVRFEPVNRLKTMVLREVFRHFLDHHWRKEGQETPAKKAFRAYIEREGEPLERFATYCALSDHFQRSNPEMTTWDRWPIPFQDPHSPEVKRFREDHRPEVLFHQYLQWQIEVQLSEVQQWAEKQGAAIGLYHDLALGCDPLGADVWAWRGYTQSGFTVGAPPDDFAPQGQDWGFEPPKAERYREDGYRLFGREIRKNASPGGALRIDHVMKFSRLFWIGKGLPARDGVYVRYPLEEFLQVLSLESRRNRTLIIGEDLGTLPPGLRETLRRWGIFSYRLFYFEKDDNGRLQAPQDYPEEALAAVSTHDLPPLAGFWSMSDIIKRRQLGLIPDDQQTYQALAHRLSEKRGMIDRLYELGFLSREAMLSLHAQGEPRVTEELHRAVLAFLLQTRSKLAVISLEDLFLVEEQLNMPGTVDSHPNWSRKAPYTLEELWLDPEAGKKSDLFRDLVVHSGRQVRPDRT